MATYPPHQFEIRVGDENAPTLNKRLGEYVVRKKYKTLYIY